jgi:hypothetical protein
VLECFHIAGFALAIGMIALVDFSLLCFVLLKQSPAQIARAFEWWTLGANRRGYCRIADLFNGSGYVLSEPVISSENGRDAAGHHFQLHDSLRVGVIFGGIFIAVVPAGL